MEFTEPLETLERRESTVSSVSTDSEDLLLQPCAEAPSGDVGTMADKQQLLVVGSPSDSLSDGRDSGVEADTFTPPDDDTVRRIVSAVEYYFSDDNLLKDAFLLKHVKRNKEGFVSLKLISSFKRVKHISRDWRVVAHAAGSSQLLQLNENGSKVRRLQPLPDYDETITSRAVVAVNLPLDNPTIASVSQMFAECGDIASIRVLKPGNNVPAEVRAAFNKHPDIVWEGVNCAVVEFDKQEQAKKAKETMGCNDPTDTASMQIIPIGKVSNKKKSRQEETKLVNKEEEENNKNIGNNDNIDDAAADSQKKRRQKRKKNLLAHTDSRSSMSGTDGELSASSRRSTPPQSWPLVLQPPPLLAFPPPLPLPSGPRGKRTSPPGRPALFPATDIRLAVEQHLSVRGKSQSSPNVIPHNAAAGRQKKSKSFSGTPEQCPWVQRRKASGLLDVDRRGSLIAHDNVLREPRGPNGTRGFTAALRASRPSLTPIQA